MIILRLEGGLGNLMFQYGLGRHLAHKHNVELKYDIETYKTNPIADCSFWLEAFHIDIRDHLATPEEIRSFKRYRRRRPGKLWFLYNRFIADEDRYVQEKHFPFDPGVLDHTPPFYLHGWWQSENYFASIRSLLLADFTVRDPLSGNNKLVADQIRSSRSIGLHIRRADYVTNPKTSAYHGVMTKEYYDTALAHITKTVPDPTLFIFSDDIAWVREHMPFPYKTVYIEGNQDLPHEDMRLLSLCEHQVIANSTFGWWSAWLNTNPDKIVVAPKVWFAGARPEKTKDLIPPQWLRF